MAKDILVRLRAENMASEAIARVRQDFVHLVASVATGTAIYNGFKSAVGGAIGFLKESVTAAADAEKVTAELGRALTTVGARGGELKGLEEYADHLSSISTSSDEAIKSTMSLLVTIGGLSGDTLKRAAQAALDLSAATGKDLSLAAMGLAKAANGSGEALKKLGVAMDESLPPGERFAAVLDSIQRKMGGAGISAGDALRVIDAMDPTVREIVIVAGKAGDALYCSERIHAFSSGSIVRHLEYHPALELLDESCPVQEGDGLIYTLSAEAREVAS